MALLDRTKIAKEVLGERAKVLTDRAVKSAITAPLGTILLAWIEIPVTGWKRAIIWLCLINTAELLIIGFGYRLRAAQSRGENILPWTRWLIFAIFLAGLGWGSAVWFFWTEGEYLYYILIIAVLVGSVGISAVIMSPFRSASQLFTSGVLLLPMLHLAVVPNPFGVQVAIGLAVLFVLVLQHGGVAGKQLTSSIENAANNQELLAELARRTSELESTHAELNRAQTVGNVGSWVYDLAGDVVRFSPEACHMLGLFDGAVENLESYMAHVVSEDRIAVEHAWQMAEKGVPFDQEYRIVAHDAIRWVRQRAEFEFAADGSPSGAVGTVQDITERKQVAEALQRANERLEELALHDPLTGLANRRKFSDRFEHEMVRARRIRVPLSLLMIDIDHFKAINDRYGHLAGDNCLKALAALLEARVRETDLVARFGGEEFVVLLPDTSASQALVVAENLRSSTQTHLIDIEDGAPPSALTISLGAATAEGAALTLQELVARADEAMYRAKREGRNRVCA